MMSTSLVLCCCYLFVVLLSDNGVHSIPLVEFLPFGVSNGDSVLPSGSTTQANITLQLPFVYYTQQYKQVYISVNGLVSFKTSLNVYSPDVFPVNSSLIAPFLADTDTQGTGEVWYSISDDASTAGQIVADKITSYFEDDNFVPETIVTITWDHVGYFPMMTDLVNTFQLVMATNGISSYVIFNYLDDGINWYTADIRIGVPAQIGFNKGCGVNVSVSDEGSGNDDGSGDGDGSNQFAEMCGLYKVFDESSTPDVVNVDKSSNIDGGTPGFYMWRVSSSTIDDGSINSVSCNNQDVNTITINPNNGHQLGGTPVIITGPCYKETDNILCVFNNNQLVDGVVINVKEALCISPVMDATKPVLLELYINDVAIATTTFSIVPYYDAADIMKSDTNLIIRDGDTVTLNWNPIHYFPTAPTQDFTVNIIMHYLPDAQNDSPSHWYSTATILLTNTPNDGVATVNIPVKPHPSAMNQSSPYTLILFKAEFVPASFSSNKYISSLLNFESQVETWSNVMVYVVKNDSNYCSEWINDDNNNEDDCVFLSDDDCVSSCPCNFAQATIPNSGFVAITTSPGLAVLYQFLHPQSLTCFASVETRLSNNDYPSQICCYNSNNELMVGLPNGGYYSVVSPLAPNKPWSLHFQSDISPYIGCCALQSANCYQFYSKRASDNCENFSPWKSGWFIGDPHIYTLDGHRYIFNGHGEFTLIKTLNDSFTMQGRMVPISSADQGQSKGTVLSSIVVTTSINNDIIQLRSDNGSDCITIIINGVHSDLSIALKHYYTGFIVEILSCNDITVMFNEIGISIEVKEQNGGFFNSIGISMSAMYTNMTIGLLGNYNDDPSDDLLPSNSLWPLPLSSTVEDIHNNFGLSWIISDPTESLFTYDQSDSFYTYHHLEYVPLFQVIFTNSSLQTLAESQCQGSQLCLFDIAATGDIEVGIATINTENVIAYIIETSLPIECDLPCINGACVATNSCYCSYGYEGDQCDTPVYEICDDDSNPCLNEATCLVHLFNYLCMCMENYTGEYCETIDCGDLVADSPLISITYDITGSTAVLSCPKGYILIGDVSSICLENGLWSNTNTSECIIVDCGVPPSDNNHLIVFYDSTLFTSKSSYTCNEGYSLRGSDIRVCQDNGLWSGEQPKCLINCGNPPTLGSGVTVQYNDTVEGSVSTYSCENRDYNLIGPQVITCLDNGTWSDEIIECIEPSINVVLYIIIGSSIGGSILVFLLIVLIVTIVGIILNRFRVTFDVQKRGIELTEI